MMKKFVCICMIIALMLASVVAIADEADNGSFTPMLLGYFDSVSDITMTEYNRCMFTMLGILDYFLATGQSTDNVSIDWYGDTFCGKDGLEAVTGVRATIDGTEKWVFVIYSPVKGEANYIIGNSFGINSSDVKATIEQMGDCYVNDSEVMYKVSQDIGEALQSASN